MKRTYGRKRQSRALKDSSSSSDEDQPSTVTSNALVTTLPTPTAPRARKRPKIEVEVVSEPEEPRISPPKPYGKPLPSNKPSTSAGARLPTRATQPTAPSPNTPISRRTSLPGTSTTPTQATAVKHTSLRKPSGDEANNGKDRKDRHSNGDPAQLSKKGLVANTQSAATVSRPAPRKVRRGTKSPADGGNTETEDSGSVAKADPQNLSASSKPQRTYLSRTPSNSKPLMTSVNSQSELLAHPTPLQRSTTLPSTPSRPARNLSELFDFVEPRDGRPGLQPRASSGVVSRMLSRARTEPSLQDPAPAEPPLPRSPSTPSAAGTPRKSQTPSQPSSAGPSPERPPPVPTGGAHARTYAGASRSYLVALPASSARATRLLQSASAGADIGVEDDLAAELEDDLANDPDATRESYTSLRARFGVDLSEDDPAAAYPPLPDADESTQSSPEASPAKGKSGGLRRTISTGGSAKSLPETAPLPYGMLNDLKSITELRSKGESRRFMDELGYLFEGLEKAAAIGVRRGGALEIVTKLCSEEFARKAKAADFLHQAWDILRSAGAGDGDKILDITLVVFAALVARDTQDLADLAEKTDLAFTLLVLLSSYPREKDVLAMIATGVDDVRLKKAGVLRADKVPLNAVLSVIRNKSGLHFADGQICTSTIIATTISALPPSLLPSSSVRHLLLNLAGESRLLPPRLTAYAAGLPLISISAPADAPCWELLEHDIRLFDSYLLGRWTGGQDDDSQRSEEDTVNDVLEEQGCRDQLTVGLIALCTAADLIANDVNHEALGDTARGCIDYAFRVLVNLSHGSKRWSLELIDNARILPMVLRCIMASCRSAAKKEDAAELISPAVEDDHDTQSFDRLCLALALLTNLVQGASEAKDLIRETELDPLCTPKRECVDGPCQCRQRKGALYCLATVYIQSTAVDSEDAGAVFIRGHLAVLFGLLMQDCDENKTQLLAALPGASDRGKLSKLVDHAQGFVKFYTTLSSRTRKLQRKEDAENGQATRNAANRSNTALETLAFLQALRDAG